MCQLSLGPERVQGSLFARIDRLSLSKSSPRHDRQTMRCPPQQDLTLSISSPPERAIEKTLESSRSSGG